MYKILISCTVLSTVRSLPAKLLSTVVSHTSNITPLSSMSTTITSTIDTIKLYNETTLKLKEITALEGISGLLGWDEMVMLPSESNDCRGNQKSALAGVIYDKKTNIELGESLKILKEKYHDLNDVQSANVRDAYKEYIRSVAIPKELAQRIAILETKAYEAWVDARKTSTFDKFAPFLQDWVDVNCERAAYIDKTKPAYDVLLDMYEKGMSTERLNEIFVEVRNGLVPLINELKTKGTKPESDWLKGDYDTDIQAKLCRQIALDLGFDIQKGRLDVSVHPFTGLLSNS